MSVILAKLFPSVTNAQGDAENSDALARILQWHGVSSTVIDVGLEESDPIDSDVIVLGHVVGSQYDAAKHAVLGLSPWFTRQLQRGAAVLAIGSAQALLHDAGFLSGRVRRSKAHVADDLVVESSLFIRRLWGFQNSELGYLRATHEDALGQVVRGQGNGDGTEGVVTRAHGGLLVGTNIHGPVVVRNPEFALWLLEQSSAKFTGAEGKSSPQWQRAVELANFAFADRMTALELEK